MRGGASIRQIKGNLWDYWQKPQTIICLTTNGIVRSDGLAVMGAGVAFQATKKIRGLRRKVGDLITQSGNIVQRVGMLPLMLFPVKHHWLEAADLKLIATSARSLQAIAEKSPDLTFILPRPGCGNGKRTWEEVAPLLARLPDNVYVIERRPKHGTTH